MTEVTLAFTPRLSRRALPPTPGPTCPARISRQLALAHALQARLDAGEFRDHADMSRALGFTRARVSQIMDLLLLAPAIQEEILFLDEDVTIPERQLRAVVAATDWAEQRRRWNSLL